MARVKRGVTAHKRHKKILAMAKGYRNVRRTSYRRALEAVMKAGMHAYVGRKGKKRDMRALWISRIGAAAKINKTTYSVLIGKLTEHNVKLNRKMLSELAILTPAIFTQIVETVK